MHSKSETDSIASGLAVMTISAILFFNIFTIGALLKKIDVISRFISKPNDGISLMVFLLIINYFIFKHKKKYIKIKEMFADESKKKSIIGGGICYFVWSPVIYIANSYW